MDKKNIITIIIIPILSILIIIASYYGYTRYLMMRFNINNTAKYANDYLKIERANTNKRVIVSLYTSSNSFSSISETINSLLDQTVKPDQIVINAPQDSQLTIDDFLIKNNIIVLYKLQNDYGEIGSLISPLLREKEANTFIILASERVIYGIEFIERMIGLSLQNPDCMIYSKGYNGKQFATTNVKVDNAATNDILDSDYGILVKPKFFTSAILTEDRFKTLTVLVSSYKICVKQCQYRESFLSKSSSNTEAVKKDILLNSVYLASF